MDSFSALSSLFCCHLVIMFHHTSLFVSFVPSCWLSYLNTLSIQSIPEVICCVVHSRDLTLFLIHLSWAFTFHHFFHIPFSFFHFIQPFINFLFFYFTQLWCIWGPINSHVSIHKFSRHNFIYSKHAP